MTVVLTDNLN